MQYAEVPEKMNEFIPRTRAPAENDPHWISTGYGGLNECLIIDRQNGSVLPDCTGYAWGRAYELLNAKPKLAKTDARTWYNTFEGYSRGQVPALGAVACWGGTRYGHVAIVEVINDDGSIVTSNSAWGGEYFYTQTLYPPYYLPASGYVFQGFIYNPDAGTTPTPVPPSPSISQKPWLWKRELYNREEFLLR